VTDDRSPDDAGPAAGAAPVRAIRRTLGLTSLALAAYQIALTRVSSVLVYTQTTFLVLSVSIAAIGAGAAAVHWRRGRRGRDVTPDQIRRLALLTGLSAAVAWVLVVRVKFAFEAGVFALPFLFAGACFATAYVAIGARASLTYAWELAGGAAGVAAALALLPRIGDVNTGLVAACLAGLAALPLSATGRRVAPGLVAAAPAALLLANFAVPGGALVVDPYAVVTFEPHLVWQTAPHHGRVTATAYDDFARTDLVETDEPWVRYLYSDRMYTARVVRWDGRSPRFDHPEPERLAALKALPFRAWGPQRVLILGAGGGFDVALALQGGAADVTAVEINRASIRFTRGLGEFAGRIYDRGDVRVVRADARRFLRDAAGPWDLIQLSLLQNDPSEGRSNVARQNWVFTVEAMAAYLGRLAPGGSIAVVQNDTELADKTVATALASFRRSGLTEPEAMRRIAVLSSGASDVNPFSDLVLIGREPLEPSRLAELLAGAGRSVRVRFAPGTEAEEPYRGLASGETTLADWVATSRPDLTPATDESPFFFNVERRAGAGWVRLGAACLLLVALLSAADTLPRRAASDRLPLPGWGAAAALGLGFIFLQAGLIHRAHFLLGNPTLAVALGVGGMFVFGSLGALLAVRFPAGAPSTRLALLAAATAVATAAATALWGRVSGASAGRGDLFLLLSVAALFAPATVAAGACFPAVIERWAGRRQRAAAAVYAADGIASVAGGALAAVVALHVGIRALFLAAVGCYVLCALLAAAPGRRPVRP
jgi:spermidine synthase